MNFHYHDIFYLPRHIQFSLFIIYFNTGRKHVLRGGLDADVCSSNRYQPWPITFYSNASTNCIFLKSRCNEEGQIVYDEGSRNMDNTCVCDYTSGYDFLVKPRHPCFCVPSEEDCSCYLKTCPDSSVNLAPGKSKSAFTSDRKPGNSKTSRHY